MKSSLIIRVRFKAMPSMSITKIGAVTEKAKLKVASSESVITVVSVKNNWFQLFDDVLSRVSK